MADVYGETTMTEATPAPLSRGRVVLQSAGRAKVLFEGLEKDARKFIENNFPRPHIEPPGQPVGDAVPDAVLVKSDGSVENYHADEGWKPGNGKTEVGD